MQYGQTQNGMPWGLKNVQLSSVDPSIYAVQSGGSGLAGLIEDIGSILGAETAEEFANAALDEYGIQAYYDFYLSRDIENISEDHKNKFTIHDYSGLSFTKKIASYLKQNYAAQQIEIAGMTAGEYQVDKMLLTQNPQSALAYCYNKNKRDENGILDVNNISWYLPSIDEIEDISKGAYDEFDKVFQNNLYWSSQPAFTKNELNVSRIGTYVNYGKLNATYYEDDKNRARATFVLTNDGINWEPCSSEAPSVTTTISGNIGYVKITSRIDFSDLKTQSNEVTNFSTTPGNVSRESSCRIRAVYRSGDGSRKQ